MGKRKERIEWEKEKEALGQEKKGTASENERTLKREQERTEKKLQALSLGLMPYNKRLFRLLQGRHLCSPHCQWSHFVFPLSGTHFLCSDVTFLKKPS